MAADGRSYPAVNGVKCRLYGSFPWLYLQTSKPGTEFVPAPDWYYNFEYQQDIARGYEGHEDLLTTGYFETELKKGESIIFSASLDEMGSTKTIEELFEGSIARRTHKIDFISCLEHSARQFLIRRPGNRTEVISGYPWHGVSGRQTFVSLPGITLEQDHKEDCIDAPSTTRCAPCRTACSPGTPRRPWPRTLRCGSSGRCSGSKSRSAPRPSGNATARR